VHCVATIASVVNTINHIHNERIINKIQIKIHWSKSPFYIHCIQSMCCASDINQITPQCTHHPWNPNKSAKSPYRIHRSRSMCCASDINQINPQCMHHPWNPKKSSKSPYCIHHSQSRCRASIINQIHNPNPNIIY